MLHSLSCVVVSTSLVENGENRQFPEYQSSTRGCGRRSKPL